MMKPSKQSRAASKLKRTVVLLTVACCLLYPHMSYLWSRKVGFILPCYPDSHFRTQWLKILWNDEPRLLQSYLSQPKYRLNTTSSSPPLKNSTDDDLLKIFVISLPSSLDRRANVQQQLDARNISFEFFDAVDGTQPLNDEEVEWYTSGERLQGYKEHPKGASSFYSRKIAGNLSQIRLMHKMLAEGRDIQVVLEDDFELLDNTTDTTFINQLERLLNQLPENWDMLWLNHGSAITNNPQWALGPWVGGSVRMFRENVYSLGVVYRTRFALRVLNDAQLGNRAIDNLFNDVVQLGGKGKVHGFVADPPLMRHSMLNFTSTIEDLF